MEIQKATQFIDDVLSDDCFDSSPYKNDVILVLTQYELDELHTALNEWVQQHNIIRVQTVAGISNDIKYFLEEIRNDEEGR